MRRPNSPARRPRETFGERRERRAGVSDVTEVLDAAARFLETRSRSTAEVRRRLATAGYRPGLVDEAIERLAAQRYLDDEAFARSWVESRDRARPRGERALRLELAQKGIDRATVDLVLAERSGLAERSELGGADATPGRDALTNPVETLSADERAAMRLLERHRRSLEREPDLRKRRQKAYALLARSGFDPEICRDAAGASVANTLDARDDSDAP